MKVSVAAIAVAALLSTAAHAESAGVIKDRITILAPGVEWPARPGLDASTFRARHALGDGPLLLSLGRLTARKGLAEFVERVLPSLRAAVPDLQLIIIGREPAEALKHGQGERARIEACAAGRGRSRRCARRVRRWRSSSRNSATSGRSQ